MANSIKVLYVEDDVEVADGFRAEAKANRVQVVKHVTNSSDAINYLSQNHRKINAIVLDGIFPDKTDASHKPGDKIPLSKVIEEVKSILHKENRHIPYCILTGQIDKDDRDTLLHEVEIFYKGGQNRELFNYLKKEVERSESYQIKANYSDVFSLFEAGFLPEDKELDLIQILGKVDSKGKYNADDAFNPIRKMYEMLITELYNQALEADKNQDVVPEKLFNNAGHLNITWSYYYLAGYDVRVDKNDIIIPARKEAVWPEHVSRLAKMLVDVCNNSSHDYPEDVHHYTYKSVTYALLELLLWYKNFIKNYR